MKYGYTVADGASQEVFKEVVPFITEQLHYKPSGGVLEDVDGSLMQEFTKDGNGLTLISDGQVDYVAIISEVELPIECLVKWTEDD